MAPDETAPPAPAPDDDVQSSADIYTLLATMVSVLAGAAWAALGLVSEPGGRPPQRHLEQARLAIDLCDYITGRLEGRVPAESHKSLQQTVANLKLNFVEQQARAQKVQPEAAGGDTP